MIGYLTLLCTLLCKQVVLDVNSETCLLYSVPVPVQSTLMKVHGLGLLLVVTVSHACVLCWRGSETLSVTAEQMRMRFQTEWYDTIPKV